MNKNQIKAGLKKENLEFFRTYKFLGILITFLFFAITDIVTIKFTPDILKAAGVDPSMMGASFNPNFTAAMTSFIGDALMIGMLVAFIVLRNPGGKDVASQSCIIPISCGMKRSNFVISKFLYYPVAVMLISVLSYLFAAGLSLMIFDDPNLKIEIIIKSLISFAVFVFFGVVLMLSLGISTGKAGISAVVVLIIFNFAPSLLSLGKINKYNPFALYSFSATFENTDSTNFLFHLL